MCKRRCRIRCGEVLPAWMKSRLRAAWPRWRNCGRLRCGSGSAVCDGRNAAEWRWYEEMKQRDNEVKKKAGRTKIAQDNYADAESGEQMLWLRRRQCRRNEADVRTG